MGSVDPMKARSTARCQAQHGDLGVESAGVLGGNVDQ
jgi:hypothetical protein